MKKEKVAISIDKSLLDMVDSKVDGSTIRSRSHAIEYFLRQGLGNQQLTTAVILLKGDHQKISQRPFKGKPLLQHQVEFFHSFGINHIMVITQQHAGLKAFETFANMVSPDLHILVISSKGNADALHQARKELPDAPLVVISGDTFNDFDLHAMIKKHYSLDKLAIMGLMTRDHPSAYGSVILDGDFVINFQEKSKSTTSHIVNAGIYLFKPEAFELFEYATSLEKDVFPRMCRIKQLGGYFTYGEYSHFDEM